MSRCALRAKKCNMRYLRRCQLMIMRQQKKGRIIYFGHARVDELPGWSGRALYAAAKAGLASFMKSVALEEAPHGITLNMIAPGDIRQDKKAMTIEEVIAVHDNKPSFV